MEDSIVLFRVITRIPYFKVIFLRIDDYHYNIFMYFEIALFAFLENAFATNLRATNMS